MLTWDAGPVAEWLPHGVDGWEDGPFKNVFRSTGFKKNTAAAAGGGGGGGHTCSPTTLTNGNATANGNGEQGTSSSSSGGSGSIEANMDRLPRGMREVLERQWHLYEELHAARFHPPPPKHSK
jgi:hypothetical protein